MGLSVTTLDEPGKQKLDGIVQKMIDNGEPEDNIRWVVDDFKSRYTPTEPLKKKDASVGGIGSIAGGQDGRSNGLLEEGNIDLYKQPSVINPQTGGKSTVWSMSIGTDKGETLISRVTPDGRILSPNQAIDYYRKTGKHLGVFKDVKSADEYAEKLHQEYASGKYDPSLSSAGNAIGDAGNKPPIDPNDPLKSLNSEILSRTRRFDAPRSESTSQQNLSAENQIAKEQTPSDDKILPHIAKQQMDDIKQNAFTGQQAKAWIAKKGTVDPNNETDVAAKETSDDVDTIKKTLSDNNGDIPKSAIDYYSKQDSPIGAQLRTIMKGGKEVPKIVVGELTKAFTNNKRVDEVAHEDQSTALKYNEYKNNLYNEFTELHVKHIVESIAQGREDYGYNNAWLNIPGQKTNDEIIDKLVADGKLNPNDKIFYQKTAGPLINMGLYDIKTPGVAETFAKSAVKGIEDIPKGVWDLTGGNFESKSDRANRIMQEDFSQTNPKFKGSHDFSNTIGTFTGVAVPLALGSEGLKAMDIVKSSKLANELSMGATFYHDIQKENDRDHPDNPGLSKLLSVIQTGVFMKLNPKLPNLAKDVVMETKPVISDMLSKLQAGEITANEAKQNIVTKAMDYIGNKLSDGGKKAIAMSTNMALATGINDVVSQAVNGKVDIGSTGEKMAKTFAGMLVGGSVLSLLGAKGGSDAKPEIYDQLATHKDEVQKQIEAQADIDPDFAKRAPEMLSNLDHLVGVKEELAGHDDLSDNQKKKYQLLSLQQKVLQDKIESKPDKELTTKDQTKLDDIKEEKQKVLTQNDEILKQIGDAIDKDLPEFLREGAKKDPEAMMREAAEQLNSTKGEAETARKFYGDTISDAALKMFPDAKTNVNPEGEYAKQIANEENKNTEDNVESIKAEIEKRRQEEIEKRFFLSEYSDKERGKFLKNPERYFSKIISEINETLSKAPDADYTPEYYDKQLVKLKEINSKYDAELVALDNGSTPPNEEVKQKPNETVIPEDTEQAKIPQPDDAKIGEVEQPAEGGGEPPTEAGEETVSGDGKEDKWTAIKKERLKEISGVKEVFEKEPNRKWGEIQQSALEAVAKEYPDKNLYEAVKSKTELLANKYDNKEDYNPTAKDLAVIQEFKRQTENKVDQMKDRLNSNDDLVRQAALAEAESYGNDLVNASKALHTRAAGTAFGFRASESKMDANYGLQIRRADLMRAQGGEKLSDDQMKWTQDMWDKEKELMKKEQEIREQGMRNDFDKKIESLKKEYDAKLKKGGVEKKEKTLSQKGKDIADKIRKLKTDKNNVNLDFTLGTWNLAVEGVAKLVEGGATIAEAIQKMVDDGIIAFKEDKDRKEFEARISEGVGIPDKSEMLAKIKEYAEKNALTDVDNEMAGTPLIKDYVESHIGETDQKDLLDVAAKDLKEVLPNITKEKLIEAYLKEGEFKQPTKKDLEGGIAEAKKQLRNIAKMTEDIQDLEDMKELRKRAFGSDREKSDYEKELLGKKNEKIKALKEERDKIRKQEMDAKKKADKLQELTAAIDRAENGRDQIKSFRIRPSKTVDEEIRSKQKELKRAIQDNTPEDKVQSDKLKQSKLLAEQKIKQYEEKIKDKNFVEKEPSTLKKADAELIRLNKQKAVIETEYRRNQRKVEEKSKHFIERIGDFARGIYVAALIGSPATFAKIASMSIIRPFSEAATKLSFGKVFNTFFPKIAAAAKRGGEGNSMEQMRRGFQAYFRNIGEKGFEKKYEASEKKYNDAREAYDNYKASDNPNPKKLQSLKNEMNNKLVGVSGSLIYQFLGKSSLKDALQAFVSRSNNIERQFGGGEKESIKDGNALDKINYLINFVGRSHSALKTFSGRFSFAAGFMARLEQAVKDGENITSDKVLEIAHESYLDWERGKYQQDNYISNKWGQVVKSINEKMRDNPEWNKYNKVTSTMLRSEVAITRVPVNILHEQVVEYTIGAFKALKMAKKAWGKAKMDAKEEGLADSPDFKKRVGEIVSNMDEKQAATIARYFRKGGLGLGLYAFAAITGLIHFGIFPHMGQKKKKDEDKLKPDELNPGQVEINGTKLGELPSKIIEHAPALWPMFMGLGMATAYKDEIDKGKSTPAAAWNALYKHLQVIEGGIPQTKIISPLRISGDLIKAGEKRGVDWGLIDDDNQSKKKHTY